MNGKITFEGLLQLLKRNVHILLSWIIGFLIVTTVFTVYLIVPQYEATSRIVVNQTESPSGSNITSTDISTNISLINTYQSIIMEPIILEDVIAQTGANESLDSLRNKITFQNDEESLVFGIVVEDEDPVMAADIANATATTFDNEIGEILPVESVTILSEAVPDLQPISPNTVQNILFGGLLGLFIGLLQILLTTLLDKRVKSNEVIADLGWTNLGSVNQMSPREVKETLLSVQEYELKSHIDRPLHTKRFEG